jgi:hypothetical protein
MVIPTGVHLRSTIQVPTLDALFRLVPPGSSIDDYRATVVTENALGRKGSFMRGEIFKRLNAAYRIDPTDPEFHAFRWLWDLTSGARPLLALQRAAQSDLLLAAALQHAARVKVGEPLDMKAVVGTIKPGLSPQTGAMAASRLIGSLRQGGYVDEAGPVRRAAPPVFPENVAYAVLVAYNEGLRGRAILESEPMAHLDRTATEVSDLLRNAHARGWLDFRDAGNVVSITPLSPLIHAGT